MVLNEQTLVENSLESPPHAVNICGVHGPVGLVHVHPVTHAFGHGTEFVYVLQHRFAAGGVELGDSEFFDVLFTGEPKCLFNGEFNGQAVAIPASLTRNVKTLHRAIAREDILEDARFDVVRTWLAISCRRTFKEHPEWTVFVGFE